MKTGTISTITGTALPLRGNDIDTDRIIPARYLRCVSFDGLGEHAFEDDRAQDPTHPFDNACYRQATILLAGRNFGCGSSREHAPQSLSKRGIEGIIAVSFAEIFFGNCTAMGIPCFQVDDEQMEGLFAHAEANPGEVFSMDVTRCQVSWNDHSMNVVIPRGVQEALLDGTWNATSVLLEADDQIRATAATLPYMHNFA